MLGPILLLVAAAAAIGIGILGAHWAWLLAAIAVGWVGGVATQINRIEAAREAGEDQLHVSYMNAQLIAAMVSVGLLYGITRAVAWVIG